MSEFKFGDLVAMVRSSGTFLVTSKQDDEDGVWITRGDGHKAFFVSPEVLTLISRHQEWVKFDTANPDCCPKIGGTYLVANKNTKPFVYTFKHDLASWSWFTHFMPLPTPPKEL